MGKSFGVICEGLSDFRIIKRVLELYFKGEDIFPTCYAPKQLPSGKSDFGGWTKVLENCSNNTLKEIFEFNDYAIIQIDTDHSQDIPFNVSHINNNGHIKNHQQLYDDIIVKLNSLITQPDIQNVKNKILFAICIHSTECWLLPLLYNDKRKEHTNNCLNAFNIAVQKKFKGFVILNKKNKNEANGIKVYEKVMSNWERKADIINSAKFNVGFEKFVELIKNI